MINLDVRTKLKHGEVIDRLKRFFGKGGLGLEITEEAPQCLSFRGGGGYITATLCSEEDKIRVNPVTRTLKVPLEADNPGYALRTDMIVDVEFSLNLPPAITVPADAVLDSGLRKTVFVDRGYGFFEPRRVETGQRLGERIEIVQGLKPGERIVISGNFLIDSESRMRLAAAGMIGEVAKDPVCGLNVGESKAKSAGLQSFFKTAPILSVQRGANSILKKIPSAMR